MVWKAISARSMRTSSVVGVPPKVIGIARAVGSTNSILVNVSWLTEIWHSSGRRGCAFRMDREKARSRRRSRMNLPPSSAAFCWPSGVAIFSMNWLAKSCSMVGIP